MFIHKHPYVPFIPKDATKLIIGTLPPPRFSMGNLLEKDVDFCYGSKDGLLWPILDRIFNLNLRFETTQIAIDERKTFLSNYKIGICDLVAQCERDKIDASDKGMTKIVYRDLLGYLKSNTSIKKLLLTSGISKNGVEFLLKKYLKSKDITFHKIISTTPKIHYFKLEHRKIETITLTAPSGSANIAIGSNQDYKLMKQKNPEFNTFEFRILQYKKYFL